MKIAAPSVGGYCAVDYFFKAFSQSSQLETSALSSSLAKNDSLSTALSSKFSLRRWYPSVCLGSLCLAAYCVWVSVAPFSKARVINEARRLCGEKSSPILAAYCFTVRSIHFELIRCSVG